jgi:thymidine kinase
MAALHGQTRMQARQSEAVNNMSEQFQQRGNLGWIEIISGSMFSGKSEELIRRLRRAQIARQRVQIFKPRIDNRFSDDYHIVSHSEMKIRSQLADRAADILELLDGRTQVIGIDEAQFFDMELIDVCNKLADMGKRIIVAGLDQDYRGRPFDPMPQLLSIAEYITKTLAICVRCGAPANRTQRLVQSSDRLLVGDGAAYEARCRLCFEPPLD